LLSITPAVRNRSPSLLQHNLMHTPHRLMPVRTLEHNSALLALLCILAAFCSPVEAAPTAKAAFQGVQALELTRRAVAFGERPSGSDAIQHLRDWIVSECKATGGQVSLDPFTGQTPNGPVAMANVIVKFPGASGKAVVVTGHYDTKRIPMVHFVGANDAGSSTAFLIEFARVASTLKHPDDLYVVFFDGEEAVGAWTATDSLYGSRHLAEKWTADGTLSRVRALINVDMIGDKDLDINDDSASSQSLRDQVSKIASRLGDAKYFGHNPGGIEDDHQPFLAAGVNAIDIIDLDYGPRTPDAPFGSYWHTEKDTMDKLSAHSFQVVGDVVVELVKELESR
jgi:glutaminyl-peptide cyclotransferase